MVDPARASAGPTIFTIPAHRSFADALAAGLIARFGKDPVCLASGRILLPNNRAVRTMTDAFVRATGGGLVLPRLIPVGDSELDERIGGALDPLDLGDSVPRSIDPLARLLTLAEMLRGDGQGMAEPLRLAADLGRTLDILLIEEIDPARLAGAAADAFDLAAHWQVSLDRLRAIIDLWPHKLADEGRIDLSQRRNLLLRRLAARWTRQAPPGFTVAAGITTAAPSVAGLLRSIADLPAGMVVLPGLYLADLMPEAEWEALGPEAGRGEETHPQYHLKLLLERIGVARGEVRPWRSAGGTSSPPWRGRSVANAVAAAQFTGKWTALKPADRRLSGIRLAELADPAEEAQAIALAMREALETSGRTAALVTPDRMLATRVSALLGRWGIEADDSAGRALSETPPGTLILNIAALAAEDLAPVSLLAVLNHPLNGGDADRRLAWLDDVRLLDLALRGPRPPGGIAGLDAHFAAKDNDRRYKGCAAAWQRIRPSIADCAGWFDRPIALSALVERISAVLDGIAGDAPWRGPAGRMAAELLSSLATLPAAQNMLLTGQDAVPVLRQLMAGHRVRPPYGGHPRLAILGLLEARLQQADLTILGGVNEGAWPALPTPDPWLAPKIRANLGIGGLDFRIGLAAHDFASALGAPEVLITRARRDTKSPTIASRFLLRLQAMSGGLPRDVRLERLARHLDDAGQPQPADQPRPRPPVADRPKRISVTSVDRLKADPFAFYARSILSLSPLDPLDADHSAAWKGSAVHKVLEQWLADDDCTPTKLKARALALLAEQGIHPMLRALWQPRLMEAIRWIAQLEKDNRAAGRRPLKAEISGSTQLAGVTVEGRADRIDRFADGTLAIVDYKTGQPPKQAAVDAGFALQLGLLGLIARDGGFPGVAGTPASHEYWSLTKDRDKFGKKMCPDSKIGAADFLDHSRDHFIAAAGKWLTGDEPFTAKLNPAFAPYGDYDQLMRLEEWYGRR